MKAIAVFMGMLFFLADNIIAEERAQFEGLTIEKLTSLAEQGSAKSQYELGFMYATGTGTEQDYKQVLKWFTKAAEQENADAQFNLGVMYGPGIGVGQDSKEAPLASL